MHISHSNITCHMQTTVAILWTHDAVNAGLRMGHVLYAIFMTEHLCGRGVGNVAIFFVNLQQPVFVSQIHCREKLRSMVVLLLVMLLADVAAILLVAVVCW